MVKHQGGAESDVQQYYKLKIYPNYKIHAKPKVDTYINGLIVDRLQIEEKANWAIYGRKPTYLTLVHKGLFQLTVGKLQICSVLMRMHYIADLTTLIQAFSMPRSFGFLELHQFLMSQVGTDEANVYIEIHTLAATVMNHSRTAYNLTDVIAYIGGVQLGVSIFLSFFFCRYAEICYEMKVIT
jgi:hypothetical protein